MGGKCESGVVEFGVAARGRGTRRKVVRNTRRGVCVVCSDVFSFWIEPLFNLW